MSVSVALPSQAFLPEDRSLGFEARNLGKDFKEAISPPVIDNREDEIVFSLFDALQEYETRVSSIAFQKTLDFMLSLPAELPPPAVVIESEEEIGLDWDEDAQRVVSLTIDSSDRIGFSALFGREPIYGQVGYANGLPATLRFLFARLYPSAQLR